MASLKRRGKIWYGQYYVGGRPERISLKTTSLQIAKEKLRQIESALARREDIPLPTRVELRLGDASDPEVHLPATFVGQHSNCEGT